MCYLVKKSCQIFTTCSVTTTKWLELEDLELVQKFSVQADGSNDSANLGKELFVVLYFYPYGMDGKVRVCSKFLCV